MCQPRDVVRENASYAGVRSKATKISTEWWQWTQRAHLLEARNALSERWKKQELNRRLRAKTSELNKEIEAHAVKLAAQKWDEVCNDADGKMRKGSKWSLLKNLLPDSNKPSKSSARLEIERLVHMYIKDGGDRQTFADKCYPA
ncbi:hypothetical protein MTO96_020642 [Rhipicephalus appendiculatus]